MSAPLQAHHRIRRHALQRLADSEERAHRPGRDRSRRSRRHRPSTISSCTARAEPTRACTRSRQVAHLDVSTTLAAGSAGAALERRTAGRHQYSRGDCRAASLPRAARCRRASIRLSDREAPDRVCEAVCLVGQGTARRRPHPSGGAQLHRPARFQIVRGRRCWRFT